MLLFMNLKNILHSFFLKFPLPKFKFPRLFARWLLVIFLTTICVSLIRYWPHPKLAQQISSSQAFMAEGGELLRLTLAEDEQYRVWTPLNEISPQLIKAVLLYEDRWFYWHPGVNPNSLV